jgi:hypothetical protein
MKEEILIKSEQYNTKKLLKILLIIGVIVTAIVLFCCYQVSSMSYNTNSWIQERYANEFSYFLQGCLVYILPVPIVFSLLSFIIYLWSRSFELVVTDRRIYGKIAWGKRVDLPVDSVSATAMLGSRGVAVSTPSGRISFRAIKNANKIYDVINNLLIARQQNKETFVTRTEVKIDETEQLTKYKELLDKGVITQEEFDAKKKQLLGL